jgi:hypothetical protein
MAEAGERPRNRTCPACRGVVAFDASACAHCRATLPPARFDYYNYTDFEPDVEAREDRLVRSALLALLALFAAVALSVLYLLQRCTP